MKKLLLALFTFVTLTEASFGQDRYIVFFTDKNNSPYQISNPSAFLSQRAINRRIQHNVAVTTLDLPVNPSYVSGIIAQGGEVLNVSKWFNSATVRITNNSILNNISGLPYVSQVLQVGRIAGPSPVPDKFQIEFQGKAEVVSNSNHRSATFSYGSSLNQVDMLNGVLMHDNGYTGTGIRIAVIDAGFFNADLMVAFDSIRQSNRILGTWDFVEGEANVYDDDWHGSMVLSTIASNVPGEIIGTAPGASYYLLRSEDAPTEYIIEEYNWASAAEYADSAGADIINSSLGYTEFDDPAQNHTYLQLDGNTTPVSIAADIAASRGMIVCNSAGNEGNSAWFHISAPADADSILAVGAVDDLSVYAQFSGKGPSADGRVKPNVAAQGAQTVVADPFTTTGVFTANGTSFSSPLIAGMTATLWQCHPSATNMQIISAIQQSASQAQSPDSLLGYGIPDFPLACLILGGIDSGIPLDHDNLSLNGPNPFNEDLHFTFYSTKNQDITIRIYDMLGKLVYERNDSVNGISLNNYSVAGLYSKGVYILQVESENDVYPLRVMKY